MTVNTGSPKRRSVAARGLVVQIQIGCGRERSVGQRRISVTNWSFRKPKGQFERLPESGPAVK